MIKKADLIKVETYCPCFEGFYETLLDSLTDDIIEDNYLFNDSSSVDDKILEFINNEAWEHVDYKYFYLQISKKVIDFYNDYFKSEKLCIKFKFQSLYSPKEYNFHTDSINIKVLFTFEFIDLLNDYIHKNIDKFKIFIEDRYTSCSGFVSSYSNNHNDWLNYLNKENLQDNEHYMGCFLDFYFENENKDINMDIYDYCREYFYSNGHAFDDKYFNQSKLIEAINKEFNLNIESLEELEK